METINERIAYHDKQSDKYMRLLWKAEKVYLKDKRVINLMHSLLGGI